LIFCISFY
jgi:hypothetical protein